MVRVLQRQPFPKAKIFHKVNFESILVNLLNIKDKFDISFY